MNQTKIKTPLYSAVFPFFFFSYKYLTNLLRSFHFFPKTSSQITGDGELFGPQERNFSLVPSISLSETNSPPFDRLLRLSEGGFRCLLRSFFQWESRVSSLINQNNNLVRLFKDKFSFLILTFLRLRSWFLVELFGIVGLLLLGAGTRPDTRQEPLWNMGWLMESSV